MKSGAIMPIIVLCRRWRSTIMGIVSIEAERELEGRVREVGAMLLSLWPGSSGYKDRLEIEEKSDGSFVTKADKTASSMLVDALTKIFPGDGILSEELPISDKLKSMERVWIIDPLDGTSSFISGRDDFSILIGLCQNEQPAFGMMFFPCQNALAVGRRGGGAFINGQPLKLSQAKDLRPQSLYVRTPVKQENAYFFPERMDSGMAFLKLLDGTFDGAIFKKTSHGEWDVAAPAAILLEAGGKMTDQSGAPIRFTKTGKLTTNCLVASNALLHDKIISLIPADS